MSQKIYNEIYLLIKYIKSVLRRVAERLSYVEDARCLKVNVFCVDKKNQLDVTFCVLYFSSNRCSTCFEQPCAHHQELTTA